MDGWSVWVNPLAHTRRLSPTPSVATQRSIIVFQWIKYDRRKLLSLSSTTNLTSLWSKMYDLILRLYYLLGNYIQSRPQNSISELELAAILEKMAAIMIFVWLMGFIKRTIPKEYLCQFWCFFPLVTDFPEKMQ